MKKILLIISISICIILNNNISKNVTENKKTLTFVANSETIGDHLDPSTMDYFQGVQYPHLSLLIPYLKKAKHKIEVVDWQDKTVNWSTKEKIILGPVWGYTKNIDAFLSWLDVIENTKTEIVNNCKFLKWNINKKYIFDLKNKNIKTPNTLIVEPISSLSFDEARSLFYKKFKKSDLILKGVIDAGGFGYMHVFPDKLEKARNHFENLKQNHHGVIIQDFIPDISQKGEFAFVFFHKKISHFFLKVPKYDEERVQPFYGGKSFHFNSHNILKTIDAIKNNFRPDLLLKESDVKIAKHQSKLIYRKILSLLDELDIPHPTYLRIDGVVVDGEFVVMELEGIEPYLEIQKAMNNIPSNNVVKKYSNSLLHTKKKRFFGH